MSLCRSFNPSTFKVVVNGWFVICCHTIFLYDINASSFLIHITCYIIINIKHALILFKVSQSPYHRQNYEKYSINTNFSSIFITMSVILTFIYSSIYLYKNRSMTLFRTLAAKTVSVLIISLSKPFVSF